MKFTEVEVIEHLVKAYKEAGKPTYPHENLYRGRNHSISGIGEDLLGAYLISRLEGVQIFKVFLLSMICLLYTSPSPRDMRRSRMPSSA
ncbi:hypothetical protein JMUB7531_29030 [Staphylococcus aureus]